MLVRFVGFVADDVVDQFDPSGIDVGADCLFGAGADRGADFVFRHAAAASSFWQSS